MRADPLNGVRPTAARRSWWLRQALALEGDALASETAAPPLRGSAAADVAILGGGYTGLWTAWHLAELAPGIRITILEQDICGGGPSGRNGGFVTGWWDELPTLVERHGEEEGLRIARAIDGAVDALGSWCTGEEVDAWYRRAGFLQASAAPAQDGAWDEAVACCRRLGVGEEYVPLSAGEVAGRVRSPVFRGGVFMRGAATVQPAILARGLRRRLLEGGVTIHEGTRAETDVKGPAGRRVIATTSGAGPGSLDAAQTVIALNAWATSRRSFAERLVTWSSYIVLTEPIPDRLAEVGWTGDEGVTDARFTLHYARTTPDGRIALGGGGGSDRSWTDDAGSAARAAAGLRRWFPSLADVRIDITADHLPFFGTAADGATHFGLGYSGNGVGPAWLGGRILAGLALGRSDEYTSLGLVGRLPRRFPPRPLASIGARVIREAIVRREQLEEVGRSPNPVVRQLSRLPRRLGYHLGPAD